MAYGARLESGLGASPRGFESPQVRQAGAPFADNVPVTFTELAVVGAIALAGPLLAYPNRWHLPIVLGELLGGIILGRTGFEYLKSGDPTFQMLANIGFALVMFVAGTHVPVRNPAMRTALKAGALRAVAIGVAGAIAGWAIAHIFDIGHAALFAVLLSSSSAALVLPVIDSLGLGGPQIVGLLPQVAIADAACIVALPLAIDPTHAWRAAGGAAAVVAGAVVVWWFLRWGERTGVRRRVHQVSEHRLFALELRIQWIILAALAALAVTTHVSIMLAGFAFGIAVSAVGEPRRLAKQLFALTEGFFSPIFFVWLGASLDVRDFGAHPKMIVLGVVLGIGAVLTHLIARGWGQAVALDLLSCAQLGVPVAAATIGTQNGLLQAGEASALILGALVTIAAAVVGGSLAVKADSVPTPAR